MARRPTVDLFCEDAGHEAFVRALLLRLALDADLPRPTVHVRSARGGHGRAVTELELWQRTLEGSASGTDLLVVIIDGNGEGWANQRRRIRSVIDHARFPGAVVACPDPHIEAWAAADQGAFRRAFGADAPPPPARPGRHSYKRWLREALDGAGIEVLTEPMEISAELVPQIDLFAAGKASPSFRAAVSEISASLRRFRAS